MKQGNSKLMIKERGKEERREEMRVEGRERKIWGWKTRRVEKEGKTRRENPKMEVKERQFLRWKTRRGEGRKTEKERAEDGREREPIFEMGDKTGERQCNEARKRERGG